MSRPIQIGSSFPQNHHQQELRKSESFGNFTPSSHGTPYHHDSYASSPSSRSRTISTSSDTIHHGIIKKFSRTKGHGFIEQITQSQRTFNSSMCNSGPVMGAQNVPQPNVLHPKIAQPMIFFHVSAIIGDLVPKENDRCSFRIVFMPPRDNEKAVEVRLHLDDEQLKQHQTWQVSNQ